MTGARVELDAVTVELGGRRLVDGVDLDVAPGAILGLLGPNGSGKSTLLRSVHGVLSPSSGQVRFDGEATTGLSPRALARRVAVMAQDSPDGDFAMTARELAMLGRTPYQHGFGGDSDVDRQIVHDALAEADALHLTDRLVHTLSGGERQRVHLARALAQQTPVLVLDEPTNHLDIGYQLDLLERVGQRGITVIAALHDINLAAAFCTDLAVLVDGRLVATGRPDEVIASGVLADAFGVRTHHLTHPATGGPLVAFSREDHA